MMFSFKFQMVFILVFLLIFAETVFGESSKILSAKKFVIFDATLYKNKPNMANYGIKEMYAISRFWKKCEDKELLPSRHRASDLAKQTSQQYRFAFVNIEHWPLKGDVDAVRNSSAKYEQVLEWVKEAAPDLEIGLYGMFPIRDYWRAIKGSRSDEYRDWQQQNDLLSNLAHSTIDFILPSLYTFYRDQEGWVKYAVANITEARRFNTDKPVYVFLWPQYHESNKIFGLEYLSGDYWRLQLETAYKYADGLVIWGGWDFRNNGQENWDNTAPWWNVTKEFIKKHNIN